MLSTDQKGAVAELAIAKAAALLKAAKNIVMLIGRASRSEAAWGARVGLAEATGARAITDLKVGASFPTDHLTCGSISRKSRDRPPHGPIALRMHISRNAKAGILLQVQKCNRTERRA